MSQTISLMEQQAAKWASLPENGGPRPDKVDFEIEKLSKELHELTTQEKEITKKRIDLLNRITTTRNTLNKLLSEFKADEWIKAHPKPKKQPAKMSELQTLLHKMTPEQQTEFWAQAKQLKSTKRGGQSHD